MNCIKGYKIEFVKKVYQQSYPKVSFKSRKEIVRTQVAINDLLKKGAIRECYWEKEQFVSSYFLAPKPDGTDRFILNLKILNEFIIDRHFQMEDKRTALKLVFLNCYMGTLDIKDAYFLVAVEEKSRKYLRFKFKGKFYEFTCLPFGLKVCPYIFTKLLKPVIRILRLKGYKSVVCIDDLLILEEELELFYKNVSDTIQLLENCKRFF